MFRTFLAAIGGILFAIGGLYYFGIVHAGYNPPVTTTLAAILEGEPMKAGSGDPLKNNSKAIRVHNLEVDMERSSKAGYTGEATYFFAPVKGTDDKVFVSWEGADVPPSAGPFTLIGYQQYFRGGRPLPDELAKRAQVEPLYLLTYNNRGYLRGQARDAAPYFVFGAIPLAIAGVLTLISLAGAAKRRRRISDLEADAAARPVGIVRDLR